MGPGRGVARGAACLAIFMRAFLAGPILDFASPSPFMRSAMLNSPGQYMQTCASWAADVPKSDTVANSISDCKQNGTSAGARVWLLVMMLPASRLLAAQVQCSAMRCNALQCNAMQCRQSNASNAMLWSVFKRFCVDQRAAMQSNKTFVLLKLYLSMQETVTYFCKVRCCRAGKVVKSSSTCRS